MDDASVLAVILWLSGLTVAVCILAQRQNRIRRRGRRDDTRLDRLHRMVERGEDRAALRLELLRRCAQAGVTPRMPLELLAEDGEDVLALRALDPLASPGRPGRFVECGAFDGLLRAVTYPFEALGWSGLLVEPQPDEAARCAEARPHSTVLQAALVAHNGPPTVEIELFDAPPMVRTATYQHGASGEHYAVRGMRSRRLSVPTMTMDAALERAFGEDGRREGIDLIVLDVEGAELDVLAGLSLDVWRPRLLIVEDLSDRRDGRVADRLAAAGYCRAARVGRNDAFVRADEPKLAARCASFGDGGWGDQD